RPDSSTLATLPECSRPAIEISHHQGSGNSGTCSIELYTRSRARGLPSRLRRPTTRRARQSRLHSAAKMRDLLNLSATWKELPPSIDQRIPLRRPCKSRSSVSKVRNQFSAFVSDGNSHEEPAHGLPQPFVPTSFETKHSR